MTAFGSASPKYSFSLNRRDSRGWEAILVITAPTKHSNATPEWEDRLKTASDESGEYGVQALHAMLLRIQETRPIELVTVLLKVAENVPLTALLELQQLLRRRNDEGRQVLQRAVAALLLGDLHAGMRAADLLTAADVLSPPSP